MSTQYRLVQSGKTASGGCSAGQGSSEPVAPRIYFIFILFFIYINFFVVWSLRGIIAQKVVDSKAQYLCIAMKF
jgi:hypothetical protein